MGNTMLSWAVLLVVLCGALRAAASQCSRSDTLDSHGLYEDNELAALVTKVTGTKNPDVNAVRTAIGDSDSRAYAAGVTECKNQGGCSSTSRRRKRAIGCETCNIRTSQIWGWHSVYEFCTSWNEINLGCSGTCCSHSLHYSFPLNGNQVNWKYCPEECCEITSHQYTAVLFLCPHGNWYVKCIQVAGSCGCR